MRAREHRENDEGVTRIMDKIQAKLGWPRQKIAAWFVTPNPHLGEITPIDMVMRGRLWKLESFVDGALDENGNLNGKRDSNPTA